MPDERRTPMIACVDGRCTCQRCRDRTENIYRMIGVCYNCHAKPILMLFRAGDRSAALDCPICGNYHSVHPLRLATPDEIPSEVANA